MFSLKKSSARKENNSLFTINSQGEIFPNYIAIVYNKTLLLMPSIYTSQQSSSDKSQLINLDDYDNIKKMKIQHTDTVFIADKIDFSLNYPRMQGFISLSKVLPSVFKQCIESQEPHEEEKLKQDLTIDKSYNHITFQKYEHMLARITLNNIYTDKLDKSYSICERNYQFQVLILHHSDYKIIIPKSIINNFFDSSHEIEDDIDNQISISVNIFKYTLSQDNTIFQFTNSHIEFSDNLHDCVLLSLGFEIELHKYDSHEYLFTSECFPIKKEDKEYYTTENKFTDTMLPLVCEKTFASQIKEIEERTGYELYND